MAVNSSSLRGQPGSYKSDGVGSLGKGAARYNTVSVVTTTLKLNGGIDTAGLEPLGSMSGQTPTHALRPSIIGFFDPDQPQEPEDEVKLALEGLGVEPVAQASDMRDGDSFDGDGIGTAKVNSLQAAHTGSEAPQLPDKSGKEALKKNIKEREEAAALIEDNDHERYTNVNNDAGEIPYQDEHYEARSSGLIAERNLGELDQYLTGLDDSPEAETDPADNREEPVPTKKARPRASRRMEEFRSDGGPESEEPKFKRRNTKVLERAATINEDHRKSGSPVPVPGEQGSLTGRGPAARPAIGPVELNSKSAKDLMQRLGIGDKDPVNHQANTILARFEKVSFKDSAGDVVSGREVAGNVLSGVADIIEMACIGKPKGVPTKLAKSSIPRLAKQWFTEGNSSDSSVRFIERRVKMFAEHVRVHSDALSRYSDDDPGLEAQKKSIRNHAQAALSLLGLTGLSTEAVTKVEAPVSLEAQQRANLKSKLFGDNYAKEFGYQSEIEAPGMLGETAKSREALLDQLMQPQYKEIKDHLLASDKSGQDARHELLNFVRHQIDGQILSPSAEAKVEKFLKFLVEINENPSLEAFLRNNYPTSDGNHLDRILQLYLFGEPEPGLKAVQSMYMFEESPEGVYDGLDNPDYVRSPEPGVAPTADNTWRRDQSEPLPGIN